MAVHSLLNVKMLFFFMAAVGEGVAASIPIVEGDGRFYAWTFLGSTLGAFLSIAIATPDKDTEVNILRRLAIKFFASALSGMIFVPLIFDLVDWQPTPRKICSIAGLVALMAVGILHKTIPALERVASGGIVKTARRFSDYDDKE